MRKKITAACLATCIAASMLPALSACGAPGAKEIENGTVKELSAGGAADARGGSPEAPADRSTETAASPYAFFRRRSARTASPPAASSDVRQITSAHSRHVSGTVCNNYPASS